MKSDGGGDFIDLLLTKEGQISKMRGQKRELRKGYLVTENKYSVPLRCVDSKNGLEEEVITAKSVYQMKEKMDKYRYGDWTTHV